MRRKDGDAPRTRVDLESRLAERRLPHNLEAEQSVLGALLVDHETAATVFQRLTAEDFYSPRHARVFDILRVIYDRHSTIDEVMVLEEMEKQGVAEALGGMSFLETLVARVPTAANAEHYAGIVHEKGILRALVAKCSEIIQGVYESERSAREQLDAAEQMVLEIGERDTGSDFVQIGQVIDDHFDRLDQKHGEDGLRSGFVDLDSKTTGFRPSEFVIVAGRPSMGKTTFCLNVIENVAMAGKRVAIFSLEVSTDQLIQNVLCSFSRVDAHKLRQRTLSQSQWHDLIEGATRLREMQVFIDDTPGLNPLTLKAKARRLHSRKRLDLILIDYLQLMEMGGAESRQQEISAVSRSLKALARELRVPVIAVSQLSRGVENREDHKPRLSDLRESGAIEQDADLVLLLYREEYYKPENEDSKGKAEVIVAKQRHGPTGSVPLVFRGDIMRFESFSRHEDAEFDV